MNGNWRAEDLREQPLSGQQALTLNGLWRQGIVLIIINIIIIIINLLLSTKNCI